MDWKISRSGCSLLIQDGSKTDITNGTNNSKLNVGYKLFCLQKSTSKIQPYGGPVSLVPLDLRLH